MKKIFSKKQMKKILLTATLTPSLCLAGSGSGAVRSIMVHEGDVLMFKTEHMQGVTCPGTGGPTPEWAVTLTNDKGRAMYSMLLSAQAQNRAVNVRGAGDCNDWGDRERPLYMWME